LHAERLDELVAACSATNYGQVITPTTSWKTWEAIGAAEDGIPRLRNLTDDRENH